MINRVILVGRVTKDVELRVTNSGTSVCQFTVAVDNRTAKDAERTASFINCVAWQNTAKLVSTYVKKGSLVGVEGRLLSRSYDDKDGKKVYVTEVVCENVQFLSPKDGTTTTSPSKSNDFADKEDDDEVLSFSDDDLPF